MIKMDINVKKPLDTDYERIWRSPHFEDADAAFLLDLKNRAESIRCIYADGRLAGAAQLFMETKAFLYVFIFPEFRNRGIGTRAQKLCEKQLSQHNIETIMTTYRIDHPEAKIFAEKHGYKRNFSSAYMKYDGGKFALPKLPVRGYCDADFDAAFKLYAEAFHRMRVSVGDFPDSVIAQPDAETRQIWAQTADERLVFVDAGIVVGYAHVEGDEIGSVAVRIQNQGRGIGRNFVKYACNTILDGGNDFVSLYCVVGNNARRLYDSLGFREVYIADYASKPLV